MNGGWLTGPAGDVMVMLGLLLGSAFFSGAETAAVSANRARLEALADQGRVDARRALTLIGRMSRTLATVLVGTNLCNVGLTSFVTALAVNVSPENGPALATIALTPIVLLFGEVLPKAFFRSRPTRLLRGSAATLGVADAVLTPLVWLAHGTTHVLLRLARIPAEQARPAFRRDDLEMAFLFGERSARAESFEAREESETIRMAGRALVLAERTVREVMAPVPRDRMLPEDSTVGIARDRFRAVHGRFLVGVDRNFGIVGFVATKALLDLPETDPTPWQSAWTLDPDAPLDSVIQGFRRNQQSIATVRDRDGHTLGIVTAEDVFEEVVGELTAVAAASTGGPADPPAPGRGDRRPKRPRPRN
ncbi:MAG: CNNM domain-containing protein [bacterium]